MKVKDLKNKTQKEKIRYEQHHGFPSGQLVIVGPRTPIRFLRNKTEGKRKP
jgi:hypothetical protein